MDEAYQTTAIAFDDMKNASLYFDQIVPVLVATTEIGDNTVAEISDSVATELVRGGVSRAVLENLDILAKMLPIDLIRRPGFAESLGEMNEVLCNLFVKGQAIIKARAIVESDKEFVAIAKAIVETYLSFIYRYELSDYPVVIADGVTRPWFLENPDSPLSPVLTLADLRVVDASHASWPQIAEFRRDREARRKLRRLRLFAYENYTGRSLAFVEDDLLTRVADYEESVRQWGFETVQGALSAVFNSKFTPVIVGGSIISSLFGGPSQAVASIATGATVMIGHVAVELTKQRFALQKLMRDNPVSFISYTRTKLGNPETKIR